MAQLSDDLSARGLLMSVAQARAAICARIAPVTQTETVPLALVVGRILARDVVAGIDLPAFDNSAVDGYAVAFDDLAVHGETTLAVDGRITAGHGANTRAVPQTAVRIFTGAPMPLGTDTVFMQEDVRVLPDGRVILPGGLTRGDNRRPRGEDVRAGTVVLQSGRRISAREIALVAALGMTQLEVRRALRVAIFSTGDEVVSPGEPLPAAGLYDANRFALRALLEQRGCIVTDLGIVRDDRAALVPRLASAGAEHDLVITSGGVSTGDEDHVRTAIDEIGTLAFWRLAIKPGRPVALGTIGTTPFIGLPGNPVAVFVSYACVVRPMLAALMGEYLSDPRAIPVRATIAHRKKRGRREFVRVRLSDRETGPPLAHVYEVDGAGVISSLTQTDGFVILPEEVTQVEPGDLLEFFPYDALF